MHIALLYFYSYVLWRKPCTHNIWRQEEIWFPTLIKPSGPMIFTYSSSALFPITTNSFTIYIYYFQIPFSNPVTLICSRLWCPLLDIKKHILFRKNFLKALFSYVNTSTYLCPFYHREWDAYFLPKASPAIHIFHPLGPLFCQSALLPPFSLFLFWGFTPSIGYIQTPPMWGKKKKKNKPSLNPVSFLSYL